MTVQAGYVTIIGKPNVGKSTLMNRLIGEKLSITTPKAQTTRKRVLGILDEKDCQIIFLDTPGILEPKYLLQEKMLGYIFQSVEDADVILFIIDASNDPTGEKTLDNENVRQVLKKSKVPKILLINKIDLTTQEKLERLIKKLEEKEAFQKIIPISAELGTNLINVKEAILEFIPEGAKYYPEDQLSDEPERFFVSEIIREKIFEIYRDEVPYSSEVLIEEFKEREKGKDYISASIVVEKETQKPIILGKKGELIKKLGQYAREEIERFLQREVYLELRVKVRKNWRSNPNFLKSFGYSDGKN